MTLTYKNKNTSVDLDVSDYQEDGIYYAEGDIVKLKSPEHKEFGDYIFLNWDITGTTDIDDDHMGIIFNKDNVAAIASWEYIGKDDSGEVDDTEDEEEDDDIIKKEEEKKEEVKKEENKENDNEGIIEDNTYEEIDEEWESLPEDIVLNDDIEILDLTTDEIPLGHKIYKVDEETLVVLDEENIPYGYIKIKTPVVKESTSTGKVNPKTGEILHNSRVLIISCAGIIGGLYMSYFKRKQCKTK